MNLKSKKTQLIILGATALVCSRIMFALFNDPEGPNLLIVVVVAAIVYGLSLGVSSFFPPVTGHKKLLLTVATQIIIVTGSYFFLK